MSGRRVLFDLPRPSQGPAGRRRGLRLRAPSSRSGTDHWELGVRRAQRAAALARRAAARGHVLQPARGGTDDEYLIYPDGLRLRLAARHDAPQQAALHRRTSASFLLGGPPGRRALPAHAVPRLRPDPRGARHAAGRADRLHAARVPADLPPQRPDGADDGPLAVHRTSRRAAATSASRRSRRRRSSCASASSRRSSDLSTCSSRRARSCASATSTGASRPSGSCSRTTAGRGARPPARRRRARSLATGSASSASSTRSRASTSCSRRCAGLGARRGAPRLRLHGANLDLQDRGFHERFDRAARGRPRDSVDARRPVRGPGQLDELMAGVDWVVVPSIWWENSPLVIQEAFAHGRPVICSDIGGMAEKVTDGVNGLHFRAATRSSLAATIIARGRRRPGCGTSCAPAFARCTRWSATCRR